MTESVLIRQMVFGQLLSRAVCTAAQLGLSDRLAPGPLTISELAEQTGAEPRRLAQLLRALAVFELYSARDDGAYELTPLGAALRTDAPGSALPTALLAAGEIGVAWTGMEATVRTGIPAFNDQQGTDFFTYLSRDHRLRELFDRSQTRDQELEIDQFLAGVDLTNYGRIVDVGGGDGALLARLLVEYPDAEGVLLDSAKVAATAHARMLRSGLALRCTTVSGDFFAQVPGDGDLYVMRQILHDWDDEHSVALLRVCRRDMPSTARLMIIDRVVEENGTSQDGRFAALMDLYMMTVLGGEERSGQELIDLLDKAGFTVRNVHRLPTAVVVIEAVPSP